MGDGDAHLQTSSAGSGYSLAKLAWMGWLASE